MSEYLQASLAISTRCTYSSAALSFIQFTILYNQLHQGGHLLPASEESLMLYVTYLAATIKPQSIKVYLYGVRNLHIENSFPCPPAQLRPCAEHHQGLPGQCRHCTPPIRVQQPTQTQSPTIASPPGPLALQCFPATATPAPHPHYSCPACRRSSTSWFTTAHTCNMPAARFGLAVYLPFSVVSGSARRMLHPQLDLTNHSRAWRTACIVKGSTRVPAAPQRPRSKGKY